MLSWTLVNMEWTRHVLENMDPHLLVELDIGEYGVDAPGLGEHGAEGEGEAGHQNPGLPRAHVGKRRL